ncbi:MAG: HAMP domain-containing protein [Planctomycetes bacterium]|nr:HAMP domain-containing protein [Planctomycetota bacterium]
MKAWRSSVRLRLSTLYVAGLSLVLLAFSTGVYAIVRARLENELRGRAEEQLSRLEQVLAEEGLSNPEELEEQGFAAFVLLDADGSTAYASPAWTRLALPPAGELLSALAKDDPSSPDGRPLLLASRRFQAAGRELQALLALDSSETSRSLAVLLVVLCGGTALALGCALFLGYWLAGRALTPAAALACAAERVGADDSSARLPVSGTHDEFDRLAQEFNGVLERLQSAILELRRFSSNVSHELRTPLTAMRLVGEQALRRGVDARGREAISSMLEEVERLTNLIEQLLGLARAEGAQADRRSTPIALGDVAREVVAACGVLAEERGQELACEFEPDVQAVAHPLLLRQALFNVLDNAIRYTPSAGHIRVRVRTLSPGESAIEVVDDGPGIAPEDQTRVFERFERLAQAASSSQGAGLGLAIARRAVETCRGRIELSSALGVGSCFRIVLSNSTAASPHFGADRAAQNHPSQESHSS